MFSCESVPIAMGMMEDDTTTQSINLLMFRLTQYNKFKEQHPTIVKTNLSLGLGICKAWVWATQFNSIPLINSIFADDFLSNNKITEN